MVRHPRRLALASAAIGSIVAAAWITHDYRRETVLVVGPMVQQVTPAGFTVVWQTHPPHAGSLTFGPADLLLDRNADVQHEGAYSVAVIDECDPGTAVRYQISGGGRVLAEYTVRTAPAGPRPFRLIAFGDSGTGGWSQWRLARRMRGYAPDLMIHVGDLIYPRGRLEDNPRKFFDPYGPLIASVPICPCMGNHEYRLDDAQPFLDAFVLPRNGPSGARPEEHYWFDYAGVRFVGIDSNHDEPVFREAVAPWLDEVLAGAGDRWKVVFFHEPVHTQGRYPPAVKLLNTIIPVIERHRVDLVLCGHNHMYERSYPIRGGRHVAPGEGTVYITTGAGGANLAEAQLPMPDTLAVWNDRVHSFTMADVGPERILLRQIDVEGRIIDECDVVRNRGTQARMTTDN